MDAERYARVRELFLAVEELPSDQQYAFLQANCDGDTELLGEVASLLDEHDPESAIAEGDSAKQPAFPSSVELDPGQQSSEDTDSGHSSSAIASPFLPPSSHDGDDSQAGIDHDELDPQRREPSAMAPNQIGRKRRKPSARKSPGLKDAARIGSEANAAQVTQHSSQRTHAAPRYADDAPHPKRQPSPNLWQNNSKKHRRFNSGWLWFAAMLPTALVGWWTYSKVSVSLREAAAHELAAVADSVDLGVSQFLADQSRLTQSWSRQPDLRRAIMALVETASQQGDPETLRNSPHATEIRSQLIALSQSSEIKYVVWDRTGTIIASWLEDGGDIGSTVAPEGAGNLARAMRGETVLFGPAILQADVSGFTPETDLPVMAEIMPVRNESDRVIATMLIRGFGMFDAFDSIFQRASQAGGLDVYAVDRAGTMVTNSPAAVDLIQSHSRTLRMTDERGEHLIDEANWKPPLLAACVLRVSDPGDDTSSDGLAVENRQRQSLTYSVAGAVSGGDDVRLDPYRNYAGLDVVGAWRWVDDWGLGIVVERTTESAFATAGIVRFGFLSLGTLLSLTALIAAARIAKRTALAQASVHPLSRYELISELGSGGMGVVYQAKHNQLGRDTALKVLRGDRDNVEDRLRFDREAKLAASLSSPHTVTIYDYGRSDEGEAYCVMEFLKGITLYDVVARSGFQEYGRTLFILRQICDSLGEAHDLGLVHRDVKPQNVMLSLDSSVGDWAVVFDFGLAKPLNPDADAYQTAETIWAGTPMYMAPERYREPNKIDPRSDIYSVGCIAYFLMSGRPPFIECDPESLFALVLTEQPISIGVHRDEEIPEEISQLIDRCMAKSVNDRFSTIAALAVELDRLIPQYPWTVDKSRHWWRVHGEDL